MKHGSKYRRQGQTRGRQAQSERNLARRHHVAKERRPISHFPSHGRRFAEAKQLEQALSLKLEKFHTHRHFGFIHRSLSTTFLIATLILCAQEQSIAERRKTVRLRRTQRFLYFLWSRAFAVLVSLISVIGAQELPHRAMLVGRRGDSGKRKAGCRCVGGGKARASRFTSQPNRGEKESQATHQPPSRGTKVVHNVAGGKTCGHKNDRSASENEGFPGLCALELLAHGAKHGGNLVRVTGSIWQIPLRSAPPNFVDLFRELGDDQQAFVVRSSQHLVLSNGFGSFAF
mmetsp:Transcript_49202/g.151918  ORF Transcript_49202/g.151918 Transcript_49202/m.151918 type:complete len:287 (-) Transcript_49202:1591-2451(-)